jgi:CubicO group peptidase (beta-lactamase class C family)
MYKRAVIAAAAVALVGAGAATVYAMRLAAIGTAYVAKIVCSGAFVSGRDPAAILRRDIAVDDLALLRYADVQVDAGTREVRASLFGLAGRRALHREGLGCVVVQPGAAPSAPPDRAATARSRSVDDPLDRVDAGNPLPAATLKAVVEEAFVEPDPARLRRTRAVVVVHKDQLVAERYVDGFTRDTPLLGWSMTKSVANALAGVLVQEGKLRVDEAVALPEWRALGDPRSKITWDQLLRMTSGLEFGEHYRDPLADVTYMLLGVPNAAAFAAAKRLESQPGTRWAYSSGNTNILAYAMRRLLGEAGYAQFPRRALFDRVGMSRAVMETDAAGNFVASSFMYATARDWARFGLLYLHDGVWSGERILPEGWVTYSRTPAPHAPDARFGAHFWLRVPEGYSCGSKQNTLPSDAFHAVGHEGQFLTIIPSRSLVLVRLGLTRYPCVWNHQRFVHSVLEALQ